MTSLLLLLILYMPHNPALKGLQSSQYPNVGEDPQGAMQLALEHLRAQYPTESKKTNLRPMNWYDKLTSPKFTKALTWPTGTIAYDPAFVSPNMNENREVMAHELTHVNQNLRRPWYSRFIPQRQDFQPYLDRPDEQEAFQSGARQKSRMMDITLPNY